MLYLTPALGLVAFSTLCRGFRGPYDYGGSPAALDRRQSFSDRIIIVNLWNGTEDSVPARLEVRELKKDIYKWNLYILALSMLQWTNASEPDSWYQIAGKAIPIPFPWLTRTVRRVDPACPTRNSRVSLRPLEWGHGPK